ncbi:DUF2189 domain-containing protein [Salipiger sp. P9]|uniref:DUF2189 domain-containing protein n=1 Tax=Salipiger pentaromativorans TaxID=2943193 RepID=UPI002157C723|nr:DUF2189 domain-containing protein [Salipiger pentaromativorans]MCR8549027.1 DUF2189 domain-containing protein [Salipiger pentaromativorans]
MAHTIGNPLSWTAQRLSGAGHHLAAASRALGSQDIAEPQIRRLEMSDIGAALRAGWEDFEACRSDVMFLVLVYPVAGLLLMGIGLQMALLPLLFPLISGFAILGPVAAVGLYEMSRQRERGEAPRWGHAFAVLGSPGFGAMLIMGLYLAALFVVWMLTAAEIHAAIMGPAVPESLGAFAAQVFTTAGGWALIVIGGGVGFLFALMALATSVVSFPLVLDRHVGAPLAVATSIRVLRENPRVVLSWGALIAAMMVLAAIPLLLGLIVVLPVLGHASWHFYRRAVV